MSSKVQNFRGSNAKLYINGKEIGVLRNIAYDVERVDTRQHWAGGTQKPKQEKTMADIKVITVTAGDDFVKMLEKLIGASLTDLAAGKVPQSYTTAPESTEECEDPCEGCDGCEEEVEEPSVPFGEETDDEDNEAFYRTVAVPEAGDLNVVVTQEGVEINAESIDGESYHSVFAPRGAFDEVEAYYDADSEELLVALVKVPDEGKVVEIDGW